MIAFVSCALHPRGTPDDALAAEALERLGQRVDTVLWTDPAVRWDDYALIVLRSTWDYFLRPREFRDWVLSRQRLWNPQATVMWNLDKRYLIELEGRGVPTIPSRLIERGPLLLEWPEAVLKPTISGGAHRTFRIGAGALSPAEAERALEEILEDSAAIVQPFVPEVARDGEWSLIFFEGIFSHAVRKLPAAGDFRTQEKHGAQTHAAVPPAPVLEAAANALRSAGQETLYARVDGVQAGGRFLLMELELIEPSLYFLGDRAAADRFAAAIGDKL
jgi:hypothetical protein